MKRGPRQSTDHGEVRPDLIKKTFLFSRTTSQNLAVAALALGVEQADIVREAVDQKLELMGLKRNISPRLPAVDDVDSMARAHRAVAG